MRWWKVNVKCWICYAISICYNIENHVFNVMHLLYIISLFVLFAVSCVYVYLLLINHSGVALWDILLTNRFWWQWLAEFLATYTTLFTAVSHYAPFKIVCGLHLESYCIYKNYNILWVYLCLEPTTSSLSTFYFYLSKKTMPNVWLYCFNFHPVWPLEILLTISFKIGKRNSSGWVVDNLQSLFDH